jgi:hypothetical protein
MVLPSTFSPRLIPSTTKYIKEREINNLFVLLSFLYPSEKDAPIFVFRVLIVAGSSLEMFSSPHIEAYTALLFSPF